MVETINRLVRTSRQLLQELGTGADHGGDRGAGGDAGLERVSEILKMSQEPVSLETPVGEEEDSHLGDFIQDDNVAVPQEAAAFTLLHEQLMEVLDTLTEREQKVLRLRFGLDDGRPRTLEEVGRQFHVTRETDPPDRGQGAAQAAPPKQEQKTQGLSGMTERRMEEKRKGSLSAPPWLRLSGRLLLVADFVPAGGSLADIGTDHGYVPIYLACTGKIECALAVDVGKGPLERAKSHVRDYEEWIKARGQIAVPIKTRLSDGLSALAPGEADTVVMAGMGGELVIRILEAGRFMWGERENMGSLAPV